MTTREKGKCEMDGGLKSVTSARRRLHPEYGKEPMLENWIREWMRNSSQMFVTNGGPGDPVMNGGESAGNISPNSLEIHWMYCTSAELNSSKSTHWKLLRRIVKHAYRIPTVRSLTEEESW